LDLRNSLLDAKMVMSNLAHDERVKFGATFVSFRRLRDGWVFATPIGAKGAPPGSRHQRRYALYGMAFHCPFLAILLRPRFMEPVRSGRRRCLMTVTVRRRMIAKTPELRLC
jgi:hypothetical protein